MTPGEAGAGVPSIRPVSGTDPPRMTGRTIPAHQTPQPPVTEIGNSPVWYGHSSFILFPGYPVQSKRRLFDSLHYWMHSPLGVPDVVPLARRAKEGNIPDGPE